MRLLRFLGMNLALMALSLGLAGAAAHAEVYGTLTINAGGGTTVLTPESFAELPRAELRTVTPFTDGEQHFEGVWLIDLLANAGAAFAADVQASALDDYTVTIPALDVAGVRILVTDRQNGEPLDPDGMGPYWIIYPSDSGVEKAQDRMIWQLKSLTVQ